MKISYIIFLMENIRDTIIENIKEKYGLIDLEIEQNLVLHKNKNGEILAGLMLNNFLQDKCFYLFKVELEKENIDEQFSLISQIKFFSDKNSIFIRRLEFTDQNNKGKGYASQMIKFFEEYCNKNDYKSIYGELIPLHNESLEKVENYYLRNGYTISTENGQKMISKSLEQVEENIF